MAKNKNLDYWISREKKFIESQLKNDLRIDKKIEYMFNSAIRNITNDINKFYASYAMSQGLTLSEARKKVGAFDVLDFEETAEKMVNKKDFSDYANDRLKLYNATMKINRLEMLKAEIGLDLIDLDVDVEALIDEQISSTYNEEIKRQAGILGRHKFDDITASINLAASGFFDTAEWSQRLWTNHDELVNRLTVALNRALIQGISPIELARSIRDLVAKEIKNSTYVAQRLMRTEIARAQDEAQNRAFKKYGVEYIKWVAEPSACEACLDIAAENDGIYSINKAPNIPIHPNCRCSKVAYIK